MTLVCDTCKERYTDTLVIVEEPCPKVSCRGWLEEERDEDVLKAHPSDSPTEGTDDGE